MYRKWHESYDKGVPYTINYPHRPLKSYFTELVRNQPDSEYLIHEDKTINYREANMMACKLANALIDLGYHKQDRIALLMPNIPEFVIAEQACFKLGAIIVPTNPNYTVHELTRQFNDSGAKIVIADASAAEKVLTIRASEDSIIEKVILVNQPDRSHDREEVFYYNELLNAASDFEPDVQVTSDEIVMLQYTGGTTGIPKGCVLTNGNLEAMAWQSWYWFSLPLVKRELHFKNLVAVPLYHIYGFNTSINLNLIDGGSLVLVTSPSTENLLENINKHRPNFFFSVPAMLQALIRHPDVATSSINSIIGIQCGSSPLAVEAINKLQMLTGGKVFEGYGLSETSNIVTASAYYAMKPGTVGFPISDTDVRIVDLVTGDQEVPSGEPGELICRGPQVMREYWHNPKETANVLKQGWLYTGDIATMDEQGFITILDRKKDMCLCSGFNVYPREIDEILYKHPKIAETCAIGVPDAKRGESIKSFIILKPGATMTEAEVINYCQDFLAPYKVPKQVEFISELPRTNVGKPNRAALRQVQKNKEQ